MRNKILLNVPKFDDPYPAMPDVGEGNRLWQNNSLRREDGVIEYKRGTYANE